MKSNSEGTGKHAYSGVPWEKLFAIVPVTQFACEQVGLKIQRRFPQEDQDAAKNRQSPRNHIFRGVSDRSLTAAERSQHKDLQSHLCQLARFCLDMESNGESNLLENIKLVWFLCVIRLQCFLQCMEKLGKSPNTIANHAKSFEIVRGLHLCWKLMSSV